MAQFVTHQYGSRLTSREVNLRFGDLLKNSILTGFRIRQGSLPHKISIVRESDASSVLVTPFGVRVEEDADLIDVLSVRPNEGPTDRIDTVCLVHVPSDVAVPATYDVIEGIPGSGLPVTLPGTGRFMALGYVRVPANNVPINPLDVTPIDHGLSLLQVKGNAEFYNHTVFSKEVDFLSSASISQNLNIGNDLEVDRNLQVLGTGTVYGEFTVKNRMTLESALSVTGPTYLQDTLAVEGLVDLQGDLSVLGNTHLKSHLNVDAGVDVLGDLSVSEDTTLSGTLYVGGSSTFVSSAAFQGLVTLQQNPTQASHAANKAYVDSVANGLGDKKAVRVTTLSNLTLSGLQVVDGVPLVEGDRILVKNQINGMENGIYIVSSGAWMRAEDADGTNVSGAQEVKDGMHCFVEEGTKYAGSAWVLVTDNPITLGTTPLEFVQFASAGQSIAGEGLKKDGNEIAVIPATTATLGGVKDGDGVYIDVDGVLSADVGDGLTFSGTSPNKKVTININPGLVLTGTSPNKLLGPDFTTTGEDNGDSTKVARGNHLHDSRYFRRDAHSLPTADNSFDLGSAAYRLRNLYAATLNGALVGNADTASQWQNARTITVDGAETGSVSLDGSGDVTLSLTRNHNHDDRYYTETEADNRFAPSSHTHDDRYYTETEADERFTPLVHHHDDRYYTETETDERYLRRDVSTVPTTDNLVGLGSETKRFSFIYAANVYGNIIGSTTGDVSGNAATASQWQNARTITVDGAETGSVSLDGSGDVTLTLTRNHDHDDSYYTETEADIRFAPVSHTHDDRYYTETESDIRFAPVSHTHDDRYYTETESDNRFAPVSHTHDDRYYTETEADNRFAPISKTADYDVYASDRHEDKFYKQVEYRRQDGIVHAISVLSNPDALGNFGTLTMTFYDNTGVAVVQTQTWTLTYDDKKNIISKVLN